MFKINSNKYISIGPDPILEMILSGWEYNRQYFLLIPYIVYTK